MPESNGLSPQALDARGQREQKAITAVAESVARKYPAMSRLQIDAEVQKDYRGFGAAPVRDYIPILVERIATQSLRQLTGIAPRRFRVSSRA